MEKLTLGQPISVIDFRERVYHKSFLIAALVSFGWELERLYGLLSVKRYFHGKISMQEAKTKIKAFLAPYQTNNLTLFLVSKDIFKYCDQDYDGMADFSGQVFITTAWYRIMQDVEHGLYPDAEAELIRNALEQTIAHEKAHTEFNFFSGWRLYPPSKLMIFKNYISEVYADLKASKSLGFKGAKAAKVYRYKSEKLLSKDAVAMNKAYNTHPSPNFRIQMLEEGYFDVVTIHKIAKYVGVTKEEEEKVLDELNEFHLKHPEVDLFFSL